jgi:cell wall-associated NlpC family hydrolase
MPHWADKYALVPFVDNGRSMKGADCWGLVGLVYARELVLIVQDYSGDYDGTKDHARITSLIEFERPKWDPIADGEQREFDLISLRIEDRPWHVGIVLDQENMIHTLPEIGVNVISYRVDTPNWKNAIDGFYRWRPTPKS